LSYVAGVFRLRFGNEARVGAHIATSFARALDVAVPEQALVGQPAAALCVDVGGDRHAAPGSSMMLGRCMGLETYGYWQNTF
jgi:hypothetical protein